MLTVELNKEKLSAIMREQKLNSFSLADKLNREQSAISKIMTASSCSERTLWAICNVLDVEPEAIIELPKRLTIGQSLWLWRMKKQLLIPQLAKKIGEPDNKIRDAENDRIDITVLEATTLADLYGITLDELLLFKPNK